MFVALAMPYASYPLMAMASPALSVMAVMRLLLTPWASPRLGLAS
jgi:hypothetical protein